MQTRILNLLAAGAVAGALFATFGPAAAADPVEQVKQREQIMKKLGGGMGTVSKFVKGESGTAADVQAAATSMTEAASNEVAKVFPQGTAIGVSDSEAKPELWQEWSKAEGLWKDLKPATAKLTQAAGTGDRAQIAVAMQELGKVCQSCHEPFRLKKN